MTELSFCLESILEDSYGMSDVPSFGPIICLMQREDILRKAGLGYLADRVHRTVILATRVHDKNNPA